MRHPVTLRRWLALASVGATIALASGCASEEQRIQHMYYKNTDVTPVAASSLGGDGEIDRMATFTIDTNLRRMQDDWHRMFLLDKPILSPYPTLR